MFSVLYVDDEPALLDLGKTFLELSRNFKVDMAISAEEALKKMKNTVYDGIISDYQMPQMDGIAFLKHIRNTGNQIPFILFTGRGREEVVIEALNNGADYYLQKGGEIRSQFAELSHKIRLAIERRQTEKALLESEKHYRAVVEDQTEFIARFLPDGMYTFANEAYCRYFGISGSEIVGTRFRPAIPDEDIIKIKNIMEKLTVEHPSDSAEHRVIMPDGDIRWIQSSFRAFFNENGTVADYQSVGRDISERIRVEEAMNKRLVALTKPLESSDISISDLFNLDELQRIQDAFCEATGVAGLITLPDGTPVTKPSNFTSLCFNIIRKTKKGLANCQASDASLGRPNQDGPIISNCLSVGLCNAGSSIIIGGKHIANWLIGQVKNENTDEENLLLYAREIGADDEAFKKALAEVPVMKQEQFERIANFLFLLANELSLRAYQNVQQARFIAEKKKALYELQSAYEQLSAAEEELRSQYGELKELEQYRSCGSFPQNS